MHTLALQRFDIPGESGFPLNGMFSKPADRNEEGILGLIWGVLLNYEHGNY